MGNGHLAVSSNMHQSKLVTFEIFVILLYMYLKLRSCLWSGALVSRVGFIALTPRPFHIGSLFLTNPLFFYKNCPNTYHNFYKANQFGAHAICSRLN